MTLQFLHFSYPYVFPTLQSKAALNFAQSHTKIRLTSLKFELDDKMANQIGESQHACTGL